MAVLLLLIPISVLLSAFFVFLCWRAIRSGQFNDMHSPSWRILFDLPNHKPKLPTAKSARVDP